MSFRYELGSKAKCKITGYTGLITARTEWLYGCRRYVIQSQELKDGKPVESLGVDEDAIEIIVAAEPHKVRNTGGPAPEVSRQPSPTRR